MVGCALTLQGCGWLVRDVADFENVDMVRAEPLDANEKGDLRNILEGGGARKNSEVIVALRGKCSESELPPDERGYCPYTDKITRNRTKELVPEGTYLYWKFTARNSTLQTAGNPNVLLKVKPPQVDDRKQPPPPTYLQYSDYSSPNPYTNYAVMQYFKTGIALSDALCEEWFARLNNSNVAMAEASKTVSDAGSATSFILDSTGASAIARTSMQAGTYFFGSAAGNIAQNYLIAPDLGEVARKLRNYRASYAADMIGSGNAIDYQLATSFLQSYHSTCSAEWVRTYLGKALAISMPAPLNSGSTSSGASPGTPPPSPTPSNADQSKQQPSSPSANQSDNKADDASDSTAAKPQAGSGTTASSSPAKPSAEDSAIATYLSVQLQHSFKNHVTKEQVTYLFGLTLPDLLGVTSDQKICVLYAFAAKVPDLVTMSGGTASFVPAKGLTAAKAKSAAAKLLGDDAWKSILLSDAKAKMAATNCVTATAPVKPAQKYIPVPQPDVIGMSVPAAQTSETPKPPAATDSDDKDK